MSSTPNDTTPIDTDPAQGVAVQPFAPRGEFTPATAGGESSGMGDAPDPASVSGVSGALLERIARAKPVARRHGSRAEMAVLRAQLRAARSRGDLDLERAAATKLARSLAAAGCELDYATKLARRSLLLGDEPRLREELSGWFASLGRLALAAGTLEPLLDRSLTPKERTRLWLRIAVLRARGGDGAASAAALVRAAEADRTDPLPVELLGALRAWAPDVMTPLRAARSLVEASQRRDARGDERGAIESVLQAFLALPSHLPAAERLARYLAQSGRFQAADEVWRTCAAQLPPGSGRDDIQARRLRDSLGAGAPALALGAALDAGDDARLDADSLATAALLVNEGAGAAPIPNFDGLLFSVGLSELLAARLRLVALRQEPAARTRTLLALARMLAGPLASPERAASVLLDLLEGDPGCDAAFAALSEYAQQSGDHAPLVEALIRIGLGDPTEAVVALRLEQLAHLVSESLRDPAAGLWAIERLAKRGELSDELRALSASFLARAEKTPAWSTPSDWRRLSMAEMRRALEHLAFRPVQAASYADALAEMHRRDPQSTRWPRMLERVLVRLGRANELPEIWGNAAMDPTLAGLARLRGYLRQRRPEQGLALLPEVSAIGSQTKLGPGGEPQAELAALLAAIASQHGNPEQRARGIGCLAQQAKAGVRAVLLSVAAAEMLKAGQRDSAVPLAEAACREDAQATRAFTTYAEAMADSRALVAGLAFERATQLFVPKLEWCRALSEVASGTPQHRVRVRWLKRWASLSPLDPDAARALVEELCKGEDAAELESALDWLISQPRPRAHLAEAVTRAAVRLVELAPAKGRTFARRLLGVLGVDDPQVATVLSELAARFSDATLRLAVIERLLVEGSESECIGLLFEAAELRVQAGDIDLAIDCLYRALSIGADVDQVARALAPIGSPNSSEGELKLLELRALMADSSAQASDLEKAAVLRELGAAYWDLAGDRKLAIEAFVRAASCDPVEGQVVLARDMVSFLGYQEAIAELWVLTDGMPADRAATHALAFASVALADGNLSIAVQLANRVLELSPQRAEALAVLERALGDDQTAELEQAYALVDAVLLGCYATRALHYRAARQLERRAEYSRAFEHAVRAFKAVPSEGIAFGLMLRLAALCSRDREIGQILTEVAEELHDPEQRAWWLERATRAMGTDVDGQALRVEVLLRALALRGEAAAVEGVGSALSALMKIAPERNAALAEQFGHAARALLRGIDNPRAAAVAIAVARVAKDCFGDAPLVAAALVRGWELEPESGAWEAAKEFAPLLKSDPDAARVVASAARTATPTASPAFLGLALELAEQHISELGPELAVARAARLPNDSEVLAKARDLVGADTELGAKLNEIVPPAQFAQSTFERVQALSGNPAAQVGLLQALLDSTTLDVADYRTAFDRLRSALVEVGDKDALQALLTRAIDARALTNEQRASAVRELAQLFTSQRAYAAALDMLALLEQWGDFRAEDLEASANIARTGGDVERELRCMLQIEQAAPQGEAKLAAWRRLGELAVAVGNRAQAREWFERLLAIHPNDSAAFEYLIDDAERVENYPQLVALLGQRLVRQRGEPEVAHHLFTIYKERLGDPEAARQVLERALTLRGDDVELLEPLGAHLVAEGAFTNAAKVYQRAVRVAREPRRAAHFAASACRCFIDAGDEQRARELLMVKGLYPNTETLSQLRVELARKQQRPEELAAALEELAFVSMALPAQRAEALREAAELTLALGDFELALTRAQRAARVAPLEPAVQLFAKFLEYKQRGAGKKPDAQRTIGELRVLTQTTAPELVELRAFLLAEALDSRAPGAHSGQRELLEAEAIVGRRPLIALGLAERYDAEQNFSSASACYMAALEGDLRGLRVRTSLLLQAARASSKAGLLPRARGLLGMIGPEDPRFHEAEVLEQSLARLEADYLTNQARQERGRSLQANSAVRYSRAPEPRTIPASSGPADSLAGAEPFPEPVQPASVEDVSSERDGLSAPPTAVSGELQLPAQALTELVNAASGAGAAQSLDKANERATAAQPDEYVGDELRDIRNTLRAASRAPEAGAPSVDPKPAISAPIPVTAAPVPVAPAPTFEAPVVAPRGLRDAIERPPARTRIGLGQASFENPGAVALPPKPRPQTRPPAPPIELERDPVRVSPFDAAASALESVARKPEERTPFGPPAIQITSSLTVGAAEPVPPPAAAAESILPPAEVVARSVEPLLPPAATDEPTEQVPDVKLQAVEDPSLEVGSVLLEDVVHDLPPDALEEQDGVPESTRPVSSFPPPLSPPQARLERVVLNSVPPRSDTERSLLEGLRGGSLEAGQRLLRLLDGQADRTRDLVNVCRLLVSLSPGDPSLLEALHGAVLRDNDVVYANALRHALGVFANPATAPVAPPLHQQLEQTDALLSLIVGPSEPALEALALVWQYAPHLLRSARKDRVLGKRVRLDDGSPIAALTLTVSRLLGCSRISLFEGPGPGFEIGLDQPMAVVVGRPMMAESPVFRYRFGRILLAARPEFAVVMSLPEDELRVVLSAVLAAFGPPRRLEGDVTRVAQFAERLWEVLPARAQRRIGELCEDPSVVEHQVVQNVAQRALSRAGLYVCGDLGVAVREVALAQGLVFDWTKPGVLRAACEESEAIADLVRLATGVEYSDARWRGGRSTSSAGRAIG